MCLMTLVAATLGLSAVSAPFAWLFRRRHKNRSQSVTFNAKSPLR